MAVEKMAVAILDLLGFKALMQEYPPDTLYALTLGQLPKVLEQAGRMQRWGDDPPLNSLLVSDTLFLWECADSDPATCVARMCLVTYYLMQATMEQAIPLRGAIAFGECFAASKQPMALLGKPVVEAHELEHAQDWSGVSLCESAEKQISGSKLYPETRVRYPVPLKSGVTRDLIAICWPGWPDPYTEDDPRNMMRRSLPGLPDKERERAERKIENTAKFYEQFKRGGPHFNSDGSLEITGWRAPVAGE